jgi:tripartite-type tricarboxylate transporter receptor subunit TctC
MLKSTWMALTGALVAATMFSGTGAQAAEPFPTKPLRIIVPAAPGGTTDIASRVLAEPMGRELGQTVVVENRAGGSGIIGTQALLAAPADGHTLIMGNIGPNAINFSLFKALPYKMEDMEPITIVIANPNVLVVNTALPVKNVAELVALARGAPGKYSFASSGRGQSIHMSGELLKVQTGIDIIHVAYKGAAPAVADVVAGQVTMMVDNLPSSIALIRAGKLRALAVTSKSRSAELPDVPTMQEAGFANFEVIAWFGFFVRAGTPRPVIDRLYAVTKKLLDTPEVKARWTDLGAFAPAESPERTRAFVLAERQKWQQVATAAKIQPE